MTVADDEKKIDFLKFFNTALISIIAIVAILIFSKVTSIETLQSDQGKELVRLKAVQDINVSNVDKIGARVISLEYDRNTQIQSWVDDNYLRKPQAK